MARGDASPVTDAEVDAAVNAQQSNGASPVDNNTPRQANADDPLQNYLQSQNSNSSGLNNGALTSRDPNFSMSGSETQNEINRLQQDPERYGPPIPGGGPQPKARQ